MADVITSSRYLTVKVPLSRGIEVSTRSISIPSALQDISEIREVIPAWKTKFASKAGYQWVFQPSGWRDNDAAEEAWQLTNINEIEFELTTTTKVKIDPST